MQYFVSVLKNKNAYLPQILTNVTKKSIPAQSSPGVKTRMVVMNARVKPGTKEHLKEHARVIRYVLFCFLS